MFEFLPPFKQGRSLCSVQLNYPVITIVSFYHNKNIFTFRKALPLKILSSVFSGAQVIWWSFLLLSSGAVQRAGCSGSTLICNVGLEKEKGQGTAPPPWMGLFCDEFPEADVCVCGSVSNLVCICGDSFPWSQCELMEWSVLQRAVPYLRSCELLLWGPNGCVY